MFILTLLIAIILQAGIAFCVFFFGSKLTRQPLTWGDSVTVALVMSACSILLSFAGILGLAGTAFVTLSLLIKWCDCEVSPSLLLMLGAMFAPFFIHLALRSCIAG